MSNEMTADKEALTLLVAHLTCFFWHSPLSHIESVEASSSAYSLAPLAIPAPEFVHYVSILSSNISQNEVYYALSLIYRLRHANPLLSRSPEPVSEYRILATALCITDKWLNDNTVNGTRIETKNWAKRSGYPLSQMNKMELEMLTGLDFRLWDKDGEDEWPEKVRRFAEYYETALKADGKNFVKAQAPHEKGWLELNGLSDFRKGENGKTL